MKEFMSKNKKWFGYAIYCIVLIIVLLYYRFPSESLKDYVQARANNLNNLISLSVHRIKPWPPFWLKFYQTKLTLKNKPSVTIFEADGLLIKPQAWAILQGDAKYCIECPAYGGDIEGCIDFKSDSTKTPLFAAEAGVKNIRIGDHQNLKNLIGRSVSGTLYGTIKYGGERKNLINGSGEADLKLLNGEIEISLPILHLESVKYNEIKIDMVLKEKRINLTHFELKGPMLKSMVSGTINLREKLGESTLNLKGNIEPHAELFKNSGSLSETVMFLKGQLKKGTLPFTVRGTLDKPNIRFI